VEEEKDNEDFVLMPRVWIAGVRAAELFYDKELERIWKEMVVA
jgi:hypothetical protein